ncbi:MAG: hypothetical protein P8M25_12725, partial [Paracoccaceae bacterium]|nr:hypothetical protein [Paracoccaceae bacterium]
SSPSKKSRTEKQKTTTLIPAEDRTAQKTGPAEIATGETKSDDTQSKPLASNQLEQDEGISSGPDGKPKVNKQIDTESRNKDAKVATGAESGRQIGPKTTVPDQTATPESGGHSLLSILGFVIAGLLLAMVSFGAAQYYSGTWPFAHRSGDNTWRAELEAQLAKQSKQLSALRTELTSQDTNAALGGLQSQIDTLRPIVTDVAALMVDIELLKSTQNSMMEQLGLVETKLANQPASDGVSTSVVERQTIVVKQMQTQILAQKTALSELRTEVLEAQQLVQSAAQKTMIQSSISQLIGALESGAPFTFAIAEFAIDGGVLSPALLAAAPYGVPTTAALGRDFADQARAALTVARKTGHETPESTSGAGRLSNFLRNQLGMRSVTPRQGNDPDAVLSRAEAAIEAGQVTKALRILTALPTAAHASMADWIKRAELRRAAQSAVASLSTQLLKD